MPEVGSEAQECNKGEHESSPGCDLDGHVTPEVGHEVRQGKRHQQHCDHGGGQKVQSHFVHVVAVHFLDCKITKFSTGANYSGVKWVLTCVGGPLVDGRGPATRLQVHPPGQAG